MTTQRGIERRLILTVLLASSLIAAAGTYLKRPQLSDRGAVVTVADGSDPMPLCRRRACK